MEVSGIGHDQREWSGMAGSWLISDMAGYGGEAGYVKQARKVMEGARD
jgi:hypothetical protein